jgi:hypothetical protein
MLSMIYGLKCNCFVCLGARYSGGLVLRMKDCDAAATLVPQCLADLRLNAIIWCMRSKRCDGVLVEYVTILA